MGNVLHTWAGLQPLECADLLDLSSGKHEKLVIEQGSVGQPILKFVAFLF